MQPSHYVQLDRLPLTVNGKIDKKNLPDPVTEGMGSSTGYVAPRNKTEEELAAIWEDVLSVTSVSVADNFFDLGGHSLKAMKLLTRIHKTFNVKVTLEDLFIKATIEDMARDIERKIWLKENKRKTITDTVSDGGLVI
jgi:acyl carrier protein